jgi:hypothetical protein
MKFLRRMNDPVVQVHFGVNQKEQLVPLTPKDYLGWDSIGEGALRA